MRGGGGRSAAGLGSLREMGAAVQGGQLCLVTARTVVRPGDTSETETQHSLGRQRPPRAAGDGEAQKTKGGGGWGARGPVGLMF